MEILATTVTHVDNIRFINLSGIERKCSYCMQYFNPGDPIVILSKTFYGDDEVMMSSEDIFLIHIVKPINRDESCLEEFTANIYRELVPDEKPTEKSSEEVPLSGEVVNNPA